MYASDTLFTSKRIALLILEINLKKCKRSTNARLLFMTPLWKGEKVMMTKHHSSSWMEEDIIEHTIYDLHTVASVWTLRSGAAMPNVGGNVFPVDDLRTRFDG